MKRVNSKNTNAVEQPKQNVVNPNYAVLGRELNIVKNKENVSLDVDKILSGKPYSFVGEAKCGVRRVKLDSDCGYTRYLFADGSLSEPFAMASDFVDNHGLVKKTAFSGFQYVDIFKQLSTEFETAQNYVKGFGEVTLKGKKQYVDILGNISDEKTEQGRAMYLYLNDKISLEQLDDEFVLDSSIKNNLLLAKYIVAANNYQALVASGEIKNLSEEDFNKLLEDMKQFRIAVDQKETDAKDAIEDKQKEQAWLKLVNDTHSQAILQGLGLVDGAEKPAFPGEKPQPRKPVKPKTDLSQFEQEEQTEQADQTTGGVTNNNAAENNDQESENKKPNRRLVMTITTKKSLLSRLKNMFVNKDEEESSKVPLTNPIKTKVTIYEYDDEAPIKLGNNEEIADEENFNKYLNSLPANQRKGVKSTVHQYLKNRKSTLTLADGKNNGTEGAAAAEEEKLNK